MITLKDKKDCAGCGACGAVCPKKCITMERDSLGFVYPAVDEAACVACGACERVCPVLHPEEEQPAPLAVKALRARDEALRAESSSGGVFTLLAREILREGGAVYGAAFDGELRVRHIRAEDEAGLAPLRGSKMIQSAAWEVYPEIRAVLKEGRKVLFTGTPCQVYGLKKYLGGDPEGLVTADLICHGVGSEEVFRRYLADQAREAGSPVKAVSFRCKQTGWRNYAVRLTLASGAVKLKPHAEDGFMRVYLRNYALRPSCYACRFKGNRRLSDLTLADAWGAERYAKELDDDRGLSAVVCRTQKGAELLRRAAEGCAGAEIPAEALERWNASIVRSPLEPQNNADFVREILAAPYRATVSRYCRTSLLKKLKRRIRALIG